MRYFSIGPSRNLNEIGHYPQTNFRSGYNPRHPNSHWQVNIDEFPDFIPNYELELHPDAVATSFLDGAGGYHGFLINLEFKKVLERHNLPPHHFYPIKVYHNGNLLEYYWFHWIIKNISVFIDFDNSTIKKVHIANPNNVEILTMESEEKMKMLSSDTNFEYEILPNKIVLNENFPNYDVCDISCGIYVPQIISKNLKMSLEDVGLTGFGTKLIDKIEGP